MKKSIRIGCGAGFSGDRLEPAVVLAEQGQLDYLVLECLAERTIALAQKRKLQDPEQGYDPLLERRIRSLLPLLVQNKVRLITNMGAANPVAAAAKIAAIAREQGLSIRIAAVSGDDVLSLLQHATAHGKYLEVIENQRPISDYEPISANAYLGIEALLPALESDAQVIVTGRIADPSLFLAPMVHAFGWSTDDWDLLGKGTAIGHLLECAGHLTGGYFADPMKKPVPDLENLGHPFADVFPDGSALLGKVAGTGGLLNLQTAKEQLLYEVINPHAYLTPDVSADFTSVGLREVGLNQVQVSGGGGKEQPADYKVSVGYKAFFLGEGEISYAGAGALERATWAGDILKKRLYHRFADLLRVDLNGVSAAHRTDFGHHNAHPPYEVRLRVTAPGQTLAEAMFIGEEVESLYTNGPAGGGGVRKNTQEVIGIVSVLLPRTLVQPDITYF